MLEQEFTFQVGANTLAATQTAPSPELLLLHGAGNSNRARTAITAGKLASQGLHSLRFDHSGHGDSTGRLETASLSLRLAEAQAAVKHCHAGPLKVLGSSMGAHIASNLLEFYEISHLVLVVPAAYTAAATHLPFTEAFTAQIRQPESWRDAPQWRLLQKFRGTLMLVSGGQDEIIPTDVLRHYWDNAPNAKRVHFYHPEAPHAFSPWLEKNGGVEIYWRHLHEILKS